MYYLGFSCPNPSLIFLSEFYKLGDIFYGLKTLLGVYGFSVQIRKNTSSRRRMVTKRLYGLKKATPPSVLEFEKETCTHTIILGEIIDFFYKDITDHVVCLFGLKYAWFGQKWSHNYIFFPLYGVSTIIKFPKV